MKQVLKQVLRHENSTDNFYIYENNGVYYSFTVFSDGLCRHYYIFVFGIEETILRVYGKSHFVYNYEKNRLLNILEATFDKDLFEIVNNWIPECELITKLQSLQIFDNSVIYPMQDMLSFLSIIERNM